MSKKGMTAQEVIAEMERRKEARRQAKEQQEQARRQAKEQQEQARRLVREQREQARRDRRRYDKPEDIQSTIDEIVRGNIEDAERERRERDAKIGKGRKRLSKKVQEIIRKLEGEGCGCS